MVAISHLLVLATAVLSAPFVHPMNAKLSSRADPDTGPLEPFDADSQKLAAATTAVQAYNLISALTSDAQDANKAYAGGAMLTSTTSNKVAAYLNSPLEPHFSAAMDNTVAFKSQTVASGTSALFKDGLSNLRGALTTLFNNLLSKGSTDAKAKLNAAGQKILADLQRAQNAYA